MKELKIIYKKIDELKPYENNPRMNENAVDSCKKSIQEFGFKVPIVIDKDDVVVSGHTRLKASKELGLEEVPCIVADDLTEEQVKAFRLADNKVGELADWDFEKLAKEFDDIDFDMRDFGFGDFEITALTTDMEPEEYDEELINQYTVGDDELLEKKRCIITYKGKEQADYLKELFAEKGEELKVIYRVEEIMANRGE